MWVSIFAIKLVIELIGMIYMVLFIINITSCFETVMINIYKL